MSNQFYYESSDTDQSSSLSSSNPSSEKHSEVPEMSILAQEFQFQLMNEYQDFPLIKDKNHNFAPTIDQLQDLIHAIQEKMPDKDTRKVIKLLYKNLVPRNLHRIRRKIPDPHTSNVEQVRETLYQKSPFFKIESNIRAIDNLRKYASFKKVYHRSSWRPETFDLRKFNSASGKAAEKGEQDADDTKSIVYEKVVKSAAGGIKNLWSIKLEREFIQIYKTNQYFLNIKAHFIANYPEHKELFQGHSLKNRLFQILRAAMKKVRETAARYPEKQPKLVKLDDDKIKFFLKSSRALKARLMLVDIYLDDNRAFTERIEAVIHEMNAALEDRDPNKSVCSYSNTTQISHEEIIIARKERKDKRRLQLQKQRKQKRERSKKNAPVPIVKQEKPLLYSQYNKYFKNQCKRQQLFQPDKYHQQIAKKLENDPEKYERYMQDQQSSYPSQFYYAKRD